MTDTLYCLFNGAANFADYAIGLATSTDGGATWTGYAGNPVIPAPGGQNYIKDPMFLWDGGKYVCYGSTYDAGTYLTGNFRIRRYTSTDRISWTDTGFVLNLGTAGQPDDEGCSFPTVLYDSTDTPKWRMWYRGWPDHTTETGTTVCYADSADGITWTRYGTVIPTGSAGAFDDSGTVPGCVIKVGATWYIFYGGYRSSTGFIHTGYATCTAPQTAGTYTKQGVLSNYSGTTTIAGLTWRSNLPRSIITTSTGYAIGMALWNPSTGPYLEMASFVTSSSLTAWPAATSQMFVIPGPGWAGNSAENPSILSPTTAAATPSPGVYIDWDKDGFGTSGLTSPDHTLARMLPEAGSSGTVEDNITTDVISFDWTRGAASDHVSQPPAGTCTIVVKNGSNAAEPGKYTPEKTTSTLYGKLKPGLPVWIGRNADGTLEGGGQAVYGVWAGYVRQIVPVPGNSTSDTPTAEILCEDPLSYYARQPSKVVDAIGRSYKELRTAVLDDIGEDAARRSLADEVDTIPLSSADSENALSILEQINAATASRHFIQVGDTKEDWYFYRTIDRQHKLTSATDFSLDADNIQSSDGYRVTEENVNNYQVIDVSPAHLPAGTSTVWTNADATIQVSAAHQVIWANFDDFVTDAALNYTSTGGAITAQLTNFGTTAKIELWSASTSAVNNLTVEGRQVIRDADQAVVSEDAASQAAYGKRAGQTIQNPYVGTVSLAQGVADFLVWRFKTAHPRTNVGIVNLFATLNDRELYDTLALTFDRLYIAAKRYEIIGEFGSCNHATLAAMSWNTVYELQETANQSALNLFTLDTSVLDGPAVLAN